MHQKPRIPPRPKEDGVSCCMMDDLFPNGGSMLATAIKPVRTERAMGYLSLVGNVLIFCVGVNLVWGKKIRVANLLPAVFLAVAAAFLPVGFF